MTRRPHIFLSELIFVCNRPIIRNSVESFHDNFMWLDMHRLTPFCVCGGCLCVIDQLSGTLPNLFMTVSWDWISVNPILCVWWMCILVCVCVCVCVVGVYGVCVVWMCAVCLYVGVWWVCGICVVWMCDVCVCVLQHQSGQWPETSDYCPLDLFSGLVTSSLSFSLFLFLSPPLSHSHSLPTPLSFLI